MKVGIMIMGIGIIMIRLGLLHLDGELLRVIGII